MATKPTHEDSMREFERSVDMATHAVFQAPPDGRRLYLFYKPARKKELCGVLRVSPESDPSYQLATQEAIPFFADRTVIRAWIHKHAVSLPILNPNL